MRLRNPITAYVKCSNITKGSRYNSYNMTMCGANDRTFVLEVSGDVVVSHNKIVAEIHEIREPNVFSLSTRGIETNWIFSVGQESLEFLSHTPHIGRLS